MPVDNKCVETIARAEVASDGIILDTLSEQDVDTESMLEKNELKLFLNQSRNHIKPLDLKQLKAEKNAGEIAQVFLGLDVTVSGK